MGSWSRMLYQKPTTEVQVESDTEPTIARCATAFIATTGDSSLWTPQAGKKIRVMRWSVSVPGNTTKTTGSMLHITIKTATKTMGAFTLWIPAALGALLTSPGSVNNGGINLGKGILGEVDEPVLVNLSTGVDSGGIRVNVYGIEE